MGGDQGDCHLYYFGFNSDLMPNAKPATGKCYWCLLEMVDNYTVMRWMSFGPRLALQLGFVKGL